MGDKRNRRGRGGGGEGSGGSGSVKTPCRLFARTNSCKYGNNCKFLHEIRTDGSEQSVRTRVAPPRSLQQITDYNLWKRKLMGYDNLSPKTVKTIIEEGLRIVEESNPDGKQSFIQDIGDDMGLRWIRQLVLSTFTPDSRTDCLSFHTHCVPFLRLISHEEILNSLVFEKSVGSIYNVVYGNNGQCGLPFFKEAVDNFQLVLKDTKNASPVDRNEEIKCEHAIYAISAALLNTISLNQVAAIQKEFKAITTSLEEALLNGFSKDRKNGYALRSAARDIQKIKQRLSMGEKVPLRSNDVMAMPSPMFQIKVDFPGGLSINGPRHDNDHAEIENISILPTTAEIKSDRADFLPVRDRRTPHHENGILRHLDSQFRLLREDTSGQLRDAVCAVTRRWKDLHTMNRNAKRNFFRSLGAKMSYFDQIAVEKLKFNGRKGMIIDISFPQPPESFVLKDPRKREQWWMGSRDLQNGSLVALIDDALETVFLQVTDRVIRKTSNVEDDSNQSENWRNNIKDLATNQHRAMVSFVLVNPLSEMDQEKIRLLARKKLDGIGSAVMVEFPGILYASFEPVLRCLKSLHKNPNIPFLSWIAPESGMEYKKRPPNEDGIIYAEVSPPLYLTQKEHISLDLSCITKDGYPLRYSLKNPITICDLEAHTTLDRGQCESLIMCLRHELALVQGPPGTGKSYVGNQLVKILLANREALKIGPIICVCYTNHALDQFLEHILDDGEENIIRLGSGSKSERLSNHNFVKIRKGTMLTRAEKHSVWTCKANIESIKEDFGETLERCSRPCSLNDIAYFLEKYHPIQHDSLFADAKHVNTKDEEGFETVTTKTKSEILKMWVKGKNRPFQGGVPLEFQTDRDVDELEISTDMWQTSRRERQRLKIRWEGSINDERGSKIRNCLRSFEQQDRRLKTVYAEADRRCLEGAHVIGVTTTGLAINSELLRSLPAKVLICEEAAEVLETHLITALIPSIEHAILIGDHLQLRAQISKYELSMESEQGRIYGLDESLFERLVNEQFDGARMPFSKLDVQRRMHPSISSLIRNTLYPELRDYQSTSVYPEVVGVRKRLFWLDHSNNEDSESPDKTVLTSKSNEWEAEMVVSLVRHLARQGEYRGKSDIAVITPYLGQLRKLKKKLSTVFELMIGDKDMENIELDGNEDENTLPISQQGPVEKGNLLDGIRLATVDNFQGEEAKIIIVSLVRSNAERRCGFLRTSNRINVLLSRAQHGMYIIGDARTSSPVKMWEQVIDMLEEQGNIGPELDLCCPRHPNTKILVSNPEDFVEKSPEGGCSERCKKRLNCGHTCLIKCHSNALHNSVKCNENCIRQYPNCDHTCPKRCYEDCGRCQVKITTNIMLQCGHSPESLPCYETIDLSKVKCQQKVPRRLPVCGHEVNIQCHMDVETYKCDKLCNTLLPCGHNCIRKCKQCKKKQTLAEVDSEKRTVIIVDHKACNTKCGRPYTTCNHRCQQVCHGEQPCEPCSQPCEVQCAHSKCPKSCSEPCPPCAEPCSWTCTHQGICTMPCAVPCDKIPCSMRCDKDLSCGHRCPSICGEPCPEPIYCNICASSEIKDRIVDFITMSNYRDTNLDEDLIVFLSCGHFYTLETLDGHMDIKQSYIITKDGEIAGPKRFSRSEMKTCPECRMPLRNIHRYNRVVKGALLDEATKRFMACAVSMQTKLLEDVERYEALFEDLVDQFTVDTAANNINNKKDSRLDGYIKNAHRAINKVRTFIQAVEENEQPYAKVHSMVVDARRRRNASSSFELDNTVIQHGFSLRGKSFLLRVLWSIFWNFKSLSQHFDVQDYKRKWDDFVAERLQQAKADCDILRAAAQNTSFPKQEVEAMVYHTLFVSLELQSPNFDMSMPDISRIIESEKANLENCLQIISQNTSTAYLKEDVEKAQRLLSGGTFYSFVSSEEKKEIYSAMSREFRGTGHWYYCEQGHPFTVGECGMPMQEARCPECGSTVGGRNHQPATGVQLARDIELDFGRMAI